MERTRYNLIDYIRAFTIINMVLYHLIWDLVYMYNIELSWYDSWQGSAWQEFICTVFIFLSGFCFSLSKNPIKRGSFIFALGALVTLVTAMAMAENIIIFGILTFIGSAMIIMVALKRVLARVNSCVGILISIFCFVATRDINEGSILFGKIILPNSLYSNYITTYIGFMKRDFYSTDYFSILPWLFVFVGGYFVYRLMEERGWLEFLKGKEIKPIEFVSKESIWIYLLHQPLIYLVLEMCF